MSGILSEIPESHHDLASAPLTATLTTVDAEGRPQSTAVWFLVDEDGDLKGSITTDRQKYKNLSRYPSCSHLIIDPANAWRTLETRAAADLSADPEKAMVSRFARAYGADEEMPKSTGADRCTTPHRPWASSPIRRARHLRALGIDDAGSPASSMACPARRWRLCAR